MANRRMFSQRIVGDENFLEMPSSSQNLYFHLGVYADDDGFVNPQKVMRMIGANQDDLKIIITKKFVIPFEGGVVVITNWKENNYIQSDRYTPTIYQEQFKKLDCVGNVYNLDTQVRLGKDREGKDKIGEREQTPAQEARNFFLNSEEIFEEFKNKTGIDESLLKKEFQKFILYWTEKNKSGTRQRWEQQEAFEVRRRLASWFSRVGNFTGSKKETKII